MKQTTRTTTKIVAAAAALLVGGGGAEWVPGAWYSGECPAHIVEMTLAVDYGVVDRVGEMFDFDVMESTQGVVRPALFNMPAPECTEEIASYLDGHLATEVDERTVCGASHPVLEYATLGLAVEALQQKAGAIVPPSSGTRTTGDVGSVMMKLAQAYQYPNSMRLMIVLTESGLSTSTGTAAAASCGSYSPEWASAKTREVTFYAQECMRLPPPSTASVARAVFLAQTELIILVGQTASVEVQNEWKDLVARVPLGEVQLNQDFQTRGDVGTVLMLLMVNGAACRVRDEIPPRPGTGVLSSCQYLAQAWDSSTIFLLDESIPKASVNLGLVFGQATLIPFNLKTGGCRPGGPSTTTDQTCVLPDHAFCARPVAASSDGGLFLSNLVLDEKKEIVPEYEATDGGETFPDGRVNDVAFAFRAALETNPQNSFSLLVLYTSEGPSMTLNCPRAARPAGVDPYPYSCTMTDPPHYDDIKRSLAAQLFNVLIIVDSPYSDVYDEWYGLFGADPVGGGTVTRVMHRDPRRTLGDIAIDWVFSDVCTIKQ